MRFARTLFACLLLGVAARAAAPNRQKKAMRRKLLKLRVPKTRPRMRPQKKSPNAAAPVHAAKRPTKVLTRHRKKPLLKQLLSLPLNPKRKHRRPKPKPRNRKPLSLALKPSSWAKRKTSRNAKAGGTWAAKPVPFLRQTKARRALRAFFDARQSQHCQSMR